MKQPLITGVGITDFGRFPELTEEAMSPTMLLLLFSVIGVEELPC